ncbi:histidine phosphatase family protein [Congregibacter litoralis]|uniref:Fructose-2,6-bisphosphatase n=1 Tax=Congregibacter litoralis KT71 TaxID=314285 RepID=A4A5Q5_9GAMM|nr:histidine phosphatase family protein [Congregibacter litoralis]EAQ98352.1 Fructose-2,6-bisphosphatase [Congregibacter litoralis KT71]
MSDLSDLSDRKRVYLVRHGEAAASWKESLDPGLSELGHAQAKQTAELLHGELTASELPKTEITLLSSPLLRAQETAEPLADAFGLSVQLEERFREIPSPVPLAQRQDWLRSFMRQQWPQQDAALHQWRDNIVEATEALSGTAVVFTHFLVINALVGWYRGHRDTLVFWPDNASVTLLDDSSGPLAVQSLGEQMSTVVN